MLLSSPTTLSEYNDSQQHIDQRQRLLNEQLDWLTVDHDDLRQNLLEQISTPKYHSSMAIIDQWEQETIARIRHTAVLARRALIDALDQHVLKAKKILNTLTPKLREAIHCTKPFNENNIQEWATTLHNLKQVPLFPVIVNNDNGIPELTIDLTVQKQTDPSESTLRSSIPTIRNPSSSTSTSHTTPTNLLKKTDVDKKKVKFDKVSSNRSETIPSENAVTIREHPTLETTGVHVRRAHLDIPIDS